METRSLFLLKLFVFYLFKVNIFADRLVEYFFLSLRFGRTFFFAICFALLIVLGFSVRMERLSVTTAECTHDFEYKSQYRQKQDKADKNYKLKKDDFIAELKKELNEFAAKHNFDDDILVVCLSNK